MTHPDDASPLTADAPAKAATGITIALLTHDETAQFRWLMEALLPARHLFDEIVVVDDFSGPEFLRAVHEFEAKLPIRLFQRALNQNFAAQRNYMKSQCRGRMIFFLDPDELPSPRILNGLPQILAMMERLDIDACQLPRLTISHPGSGPAHPLSLNLQGEGIALLWEDQFRMLRNLPHLRWTLRLNEYLTNVRTAYRFPHTLDYALLHPKSLQRQKEQRVFYRSIRLRHVSRIKNSIYKRLPWRQATRWIVADTPV